MLPTLPEKLLDWKNVKRIEIHDNYFTCNCSMAWLINDLKAEKPLYLNNLKDSDNQPTKHTLKCHKPNELNGIKFYDLSGHFCKNDTEDHEVEDASHTIFVCGRSPTSGCYCGIEELTCEDYNPDLYYDYYYRPSAYRSNSKNKINSNTSHIEFIDAKETIKIAKFENYIIKGLKKGSLFPRNEKQFEKLIFSLNNMRQIGNGTFDNFISLKSLSLTNNKIKNITNQVLTEKLGSTLMELDLSGNLFTDLQPDAFIYMTKLENLTLSFNFDLNLSIPIFSAGLSNLTKLDLSGCSIYNLTENYFSNLTSLETLILNFNPFTSLPKAIKCFSNLQHLHISYAQIKSFGSQEFASLNKLETLTAYYGKLNSIEDCAFSNLPNLKKVFLENNRNFSFIHENAFGSIEAEIPFSLETFSIQNCGLKILPEKLLDWNNLKITHLNGNPFTCNCSNAWLINDLKAMTPKYHIFDKLDLHCYDSFSKSYVSLKTVDKCINDEIIYVCGDETFSRGCKCENSELQCHYGSGRNGGGYENANVQILDENFIVKNASFSFNNIKFLEKDNILPSREHEVEELDFSFNKIEDIKNETFDKFSSLKSLTLKGNFLSTIHEGIMNENLGSTLAKLDLSQNYLTNITNSIFLNLHNLTHLSLAFNEKINFTNFVFPPALSNLKFLDLGGCNISILNRHIFIYLMNLQILGLYENPITSLPKVLHVLSNLQHLNIHNSKLASLNNSELIFHPELEILDVSASNISEIQDCTFCNLTKLKKVFLNQNHRLSFIHENAFGNINSSEIISNLEVFSIQKCNISFLPENLLDWKTLKIIQIEENPFICDCSMAWLINGLNSFETVFDEISFNPFEKESDLKCFNPPKFRGIHFNNISEDFCPNERPTTSLSVISEASQTKKELIPNWWLLVIICLLGIIAAVIVVALGIYFYRSRQIKNLQNLGDGILNENFKEDEEDKIDEDFDDTENV